MLKIIKKIFFLISTGTLVLSLFSGLNLVKNNSSSGLVTPVFAETKQEKADRLKAEAAAAAAEAAAAEAAAAEAAAAEAAAAPGAGVGIGLSASGNFATLGNVTVDKIVSGSLTLVLIAVTVVFFFILVMGGISWITSGGDEKKIAAARAKITNAIIGLAIVFATWAIITLISTIFGVNLLNLNITQIKTD